ncbi:hybrid sensor histidine kinase/response regulator [Paenibacillus flagellatus]|uniref:Circadian input-output histidine kinase CikA n=1 Tax=Paenibacillus flagellatus TaxID=2211139 RepID=A0A2V5K0N9_9BACL|nr:ATP-binding protein [Paenibacillus flagellatus]PYI51013.1 histidine kinase [Paenibacillus flagellatus]
MNKQWLAIVAGVILVLILPAYTVAQMLVTHNRNPVASSGLLDLSGWSFSADGAVRLNGEWEFYRNRLLTPDDFDPARSSGEMPKPTGTVTLPGKWNDYIAEDGEPAPTGFGTFRLTVRLPDDAEGVYGIRTTNIRTANRIFAAGQEAGASGVPGRSPDDARPGNIPYVGFVHVSGTEADIIVQVSNFVYSSGGVFSPILFGDVHSVTDSREFGLFADWMTLAGFLIPALYFLFLYRLRRRERSLLHLGLFCLSAIVYVATHGEKLLAGAWPGMPYETFLKTQLVSSAFVYYFLMRYVEAAIPGSVHRIALRLCDVATVAAVIVAVGLPTLVFSKLEPFLFVYSLLTVIYMAVAMVRGMRERSEDAVFMLIGVVSILLVILLNLVSLGGMTDAQMLVPFEMLLFVITQALLLAGRFARTFEEVEQLSRKLLTLDGLKDEFMANTSHELRTPLHGIVNIAQSLLEGASGKLNGKQANDLSMIVSTGKRLSALINDILDFGKLKNGEIVLKRQPVDLRAVVGSVMDVTLHLAGSKPIRFVQRWPDRLPWLDTDEDRLRQILYNLLGNAVKFTHRGEIRVEAEVGESGVTISVTDTGIGIEPERLDDIFKAYDQAGATAHREYSGTGLGLSITKKLVELGGGRIWVESEPGRGSAFRFTLPSADVPPDAERKTAVVPLAGTASGDGEAQAEDDVPGVGPESERFTVLLVDDDPVNLQVLRNLLSIESYRLVAVGDGAAATAYIDSGKPVDLLIADWMMPGMSGIELCRSVRRRYSLFELPVLLLTARGLPDDVRVGFQAGANDFLRKPVDADELRARVRTLLALRDSVRKAISSELAFLQAQIKPHFLYNALNTIVALLPSDPDKTTRLLLELSHYLRGSFDFQNREQLTTLRKELALVHSYLALEQARFEERLEVVYDIDAELNGLVPPLCIQPIVENAIRHGVMQKEEGGTVRITIRETVGTIGIAVADDGVGMEPERAASVLAGVVREGGEGVSGVGLRNIHARLLTLFGKGLTIDSGVGRGTAVRFEVPDASRMRR